MIDSEVVSSNSRKQMIKLWNTNREVIHVHLADPKKHKVFIFLHKELTFT